MQPCAVCGGQVIDAAGYCAQCGTFRGVDPVVSTPPAYLGPTSGPPAGYPAAPPPYPTSAPPYPGSPAPYPGSPAPYPGSPAPYPTSPGYPGQPLPPPHGGRQRSFVLPLVALSATLLVLVVAIVVVVVVRSNRSGGGGDPTDGNALVDECVVGTWRVTSHEEQVPVPSIGDVLFTGEGARLQLDADGTGVIDYGNGTTFSGTAQGSTITLTFTGSVTFDFRTANGTVSFANLEPDGKIVLEVNGVEVGTDDLAGSSDPARYTCTDSTLTEYTDSYEVALTRQD